MDEGLTMSNVFTVKDFRELTAADGAVDMYSLNATQPIGARGEAIIGAYSGMYKGSFKEFKTKIKKLPLAVVKNMLQDIVAEHIVGGREAIHTAFKESHSDEDIKAAVIGMAGTKKFVLTVELPESKLSVKFLPLTEDRLAKLSGTSRLDIILSSITQIGGSVVTKKGLEESINDWPYSDFEYLYAYMDLVNIRLANVNWKDIIKNL